MRGATRWKAYVFGGPVISIHAPRAGSDDCRAVIEFRGLISIHAPRAGSDGIPATHSTASSYFNPRSPCGERHGIDAASVASHGFQSTLPVRGATRTRACRSVCRSISIHAPRVGSDPDVVLGLAYTPEISIHAPRAGSDRHALLQGRATTYFNPRSPCGERLTLGLILLRRLRISIHAPRAGSDDTTKPTAHAVHISIHAPRAGSDPDVSRFSPCFRFQSTLPVRGATAGLREPSDDALISIHAPRAGSDSSPIIISVN